MGFRSTLVSLHRDGSLPNWFIEKYKSKLFFKELYICSKEESKIYDNSFFEDYQKALVEIGYFDGSVYHDKMVVAVLAENGVGTQVVITNKTVKYYIQITDECSYEADSCYRE